MRLLDVRENNWVYRINYDRCRQFWSKNFSKPGKIHMESVFNQLLAGHASSFRISYEQVPGCQPYAKSSLILNKDKKT